MFGPQGITSERTCFKIETSVVQVGSTFSLLMESILRVFRGSCSWGDNFTAEETAGKEHGSSAGEDSVRQGMGLEVGCVKLRMN